MDINKRVSFSAILKTTDSWIYCDEGKYKVREFGRDRDIPAKEMFKVLEEIREFIAECEKENA
jgi:hypothetical protein